MLRPSFPSAGEGQCSGSLWPGGRPEGVTWNILQYSLTLIEPICGRYLFIGTLATIPADRADSGSSFMAGSSKGNYSLTTTLLWTVYLLGIGCKSGCQWSTNANLQNCEMFCCVIATFGCRVECNTFDGHDLHNWHLLLLLSIALAVQFWLRFRVLDRSREIVNNWTY